MAGKPGKKGTKDDGKTEERKGEVTCGDFGGVKADGKPCTRKAGWGTGLNTGKCRSHQDISPYCYIQHPKKRAFLAALALTGSRVEAAEAAGIDRSTIYQPLWRDDEEFQKAYKDALLASGDVLEEEARRRGIKGLKRLKFHNGQVVRRPDVCVCGHEKMQHLSGQSCTVEGCKCTEFEGEPYYEHSYSDTLLIVLLKMRKRFEDKTAVEHSGSIATGLEGMGDSELAEYGAALAARVRKGGDGKGAD